MAGLTDLTLGNFTKVFITDAVDYDTEITNLQNVGELTDESTIVDIAEYGVKYMRKLVGSATAGPIELVVNLNPDDASYQLLEQLYTDSARTKVKLEMLDGKGLNGHHVTFSGLIASKSFSNGFDEVRTVTFSLVIDGAVSDLIANDDA